MEVLVNKGAYLSMVEDREVWSRADVEVGREEKLGMGRLWSLREILVVRGLGDKG